MFHLLNVIANTILWTHTSYIIFLLIIYAFRTFLYPQASHGCMKTHDPLITVNVERYFIKTRSYHYDPQPYFCFQQRLKYVTSRKIHEVQ